MRDKNAKLAELMLYDTGGVRRTYSYVLLPDGELRIGPLETGIHPRLAEGQRFVQQALVH